jgi:hypothetical protein
MSDLSRRDFLLKPLTHLQNGLNLNSLNQVKQNPEDPNPQILSQIVIGKISHFPFGEKTVLSTLEMSLESLPEGFRIHSNNNINEYYAIQANHFGELVVDRQTPWPAERVFSIMTGEPTSLILDKPFLTRADLSQTSSKPTDLEIKTPDTKPSREDQT